jgi:RES domain-containing protein
MKQDNLEPAIPPHADSDRIREGMIRCVPLAITWSGDLFRATGQDYANQRDVLTGEGGRKAGGRYNARGSFRALYNAIDMETAMSESLAYSRQQGIPDANVLPLTFVCVRASYLKVLNFTDGKVRQTLGISKERLLQPWRAEQEAGREALTQAMGRLARASGFQAILYDSAQVRGGRNLVVFPDRVQVGQLRLVNNHRLPLRRRRAKKS